MAFRNASIDKERMRTLSQTTVSNSKLGPTVQAERS